MKQIVAHKKLGAVTGLFVVLGLLAALMLINFLFTGLLVRFIGYTAGNLGFWLLGGLIAWWVLRVYVVNYIFELSEDVLRLSRSYGKRERFIEDIYLNRLLFVGEPAEAKKRWPKARRVNAVHAGCKDAVVAVVYQNSSGTRIALLQANSEIRAKLVARVKAK